MSISKATELAGAGNYPSRRHNKRERKVLQTAEQYSPAQSSDWETAPTTVSGALDTLAASNSGGKLKSLSVVYDFSVNGGAIGNINLSGSLPDNAIVVECVADVLTQLAGSGTLKLSLATDGDISTTLSSADTAIPKTVTAAAPVKTTAARTIRATISSNTLSAGKVEFFIRYYQGQ